MSARSQSRGARPAGSPRILPAGFYLRDDVVRVARELLGKVLVTRLGGRTCAALITETEAYAGEGDRASHAWGGRRTARTEPMYARGGRAYVYLCYGIHHLFNVVTNVEDVPHAVLVRGARPLAGLPAMLERRGRDRADAGLLSGPGKVAQALGITTALTGASFDEGRVWIEDRGVAVAARDIVAGPRVGVDYAGDDAALPYRFLLSAQARDVRPARALSHTERK